jgi:hypothetical protein
MVPDAGFGTIHREPWSRQFLKVVRIKGICETLLILEVGEIMTYRGVDRLRLRVAHRSPA